MAKILIVDDSRTTRKILRKILEDKGYTVVAEAANGEEGVAQFKKHNPQVTTMDITMPVLDGIEALRQIKDCDPNAKVIMISAAGQKHKVMEAMKAGATEFLTKPLVEDEVIERVNNVLHKQSS